jgi:hypothetical protein
MPTSKETQEATQRIWVLTRDLTYDTRSPPKQVSIGFFKTELGALRFAVYREIPEILYGLFGRSNRWAPDEVRLRYEQAVQRENYPDALQIWNYPVLRLPRIVITCESLKD